MFRELSNTRILSLLLLVSMGGLVAACGSDDAPASSSAKIELFQADTELLGGPGEVTLSWRTSGASTLELFRGEEELDLGDAPIAEGAMRVFVEETTDFRLVAADSKRRTVDSRVSVVVDDDGKPLIGSFEAPELIEADASGKGRLTATWEGLRRAETLSLEVQGQQPRSLEVAVDGSAEVEIDGDATLTLRATNEVGETTASVEVRLAKEPVIESFVADRLHVGTGEEVTLSWTTSGAKTVELWLNGTKVDGLDPTFTTGEIAIPIDFDSEIELRAANELGDTDSATLEIVVGSPTIEEFELDAAALWLGETVEVSWLTSGGSQLTFSDVETGEALCEIDQIGAIEEGGCPWTPTAAGVYSLQLIVTNSSGADSESLELVVGTGATIVRFSANPTQLNEGEETVLSWQVLSDPAGNVPALTLRDDLGGNYVAAASEGTIDVPITQAGTRTFTLKATTDDSRSTPAVASADVEVFALPTIFAQATPEHFDDAHADQVVLSWTTDHAVALTIERRATAAAAGPADEIVEIPEGDVAAGSWNFVPAVDTTLRLIATNALGGTTEQEIGVTVAPTDIAQFDVQPRILTQGQPVTISWRTQMSDRVEIEAPGFGETYLVEEHADAYVANRGGTKLALRDCGAAVITAGCGTIEFPADFRFPFAGAPRDKILVHTKGVATFDTEIAGTVGTKERLPTKEPSAWLHLFPFWDDLAWDPNKYPQGNIHWSMIEDEKGRGLAIQWKDAGLWSSGGSIIGYLDVSISFETILREDGTFEYRYGKFFKRTDHLPTFRQHFSNSAIGFQLPDRTDSHELAWGDAITLLGSVAERSFSYRPVPELGVEGEFVWYPLGRSADFAVTLSATRGTVTRSRTIDLTMDRKPLVEIRPEVIAPSAIDEDFLFQWKSFNATALWVEDEEGVERCRATQATLEEGVCSLSESTAGIYRYIVKLEGANGFITEEIVEATVYGAFGVYSFEADQLSVEKGAGVTLSWTAFNAEQIILFRDGVEIMSGATNVGSHFAENIEGETEFTLRAVDEFGVTDEATLSVSIWDILIDLQADRTNVRPGEPITVTVDAKTLDGGAPVELIGALPLVEIADTAHRFRTLATPDRLEDGSTVALDRVATLQQIELPFAFPYMGREYNTATVNLHGYLSFNAAATARFDNGVLPSAADPGVELAPFWDQLILHGAGNYYVGEQDGAFVIEWSKVSMQRTSTTANLNDLNFQIVLFSDGAFEYRYGTMQPGAGHSNCLPTRDCNNEVMGSSATIGYSFDNGKHGYTHHFGGQQSGSGNPIVSGGLENRTFRYPRKKGAQTFIFHPRQTEDLRFCALSGGVEVCKTLSVQAEFGLDAISVSPSYVRPGEDVTIIWQSRGGLNLKIFEGETLVHETSDHSEIDSGSFTVRPTKTTLYALDIVSGSSRARVERMVDVEQFSLTMEVGQSTGPGTPVTLSWNLGSVGSGPAPTIYAPMEEISADFYEHDLSSDPDADTLISAANNQNSNVKLVFKNGFTFPYFGVEHSSLQVAVSGYLGTDARPSGNNPAPGSLLVANTAGRFLMPFWDHLNTRASGRVYAKPLGTDRYIIQWSRMGLNYVSQGTPNLNFMIILHKDGSFEYRYGAMDAPAQPQTSGTICYPASCVFEVNGSSATIGYLNPEATVGQMIHLGGSNRAEGQQPVAGGLSNRAWKFTPRTESGSMTLKPATTQGYQVCAHDHVTQTLTCAPMKEVEVPWGIDFFIAPEGPLAGEETALTWKVVGLDSLQLFEGDTELASWSGEGIPSMGSREISPAMPTTYTLIGGSMGRSTKSTVTVTPRLFDLVVNGPTRTLTPGEEFTIDWELTAHTDDPIEMITPLTEIDASPGSAGEYLDVRNLEGAQEVAFRLANGNPSAHVVATVDLPFTFNYLGVERTKVGVHTYGFLTFTETAGNGSGGNKRFPANSGTEARVHLAPFWDNLLAHDVGTVHSYSPDPQTMIVQWSRYSHSSGSSPVNTYDLNFQVVLHADGSFKYRYGRMRAPEQPFFHVSCANGHCRDEANGSSATIGYQDVSATVGSTLHLGSIALPSVGETQGDPKPDSFIAFPGGLEGRAFAYQGARRGSSTITAGQSGTYEVCAKHPAYTACKAVEVETKGDGGDLGITELMIDPAGGRPSQWFEVRNYSRRILDLDGFEIVTNGGSHQIAGKLEIGPGEFRTLAASNQVGFTPDYIYGTEVPLNRNLDNLTLRIGDSSIATVKWDVDWIIPRNETLKLEGTYQQAGVQERVDASEWCRGGPGGSPGELGPSCFGGSYSADTVSTRPFLDISQTGTRFHEVEGGSGIFRLPNTGRPVQFGGFSYNHVWVTHAGWISLSEVLPVVGSTTFGPSSLPRPITTTSALGPIVSAFWGSLTCNREAFDCKFFYERRTVDGHSVLVLQWDNYKYLSGQNPLDGSLSFQIQLWENGDVVVAYDEVDNPHGYFSSNWLNLQGNTAWVGLEVSNADWSTAHFKRPLGLGRRSFSFTRK